MARKISAKPGSKRQVFPVDVDTYRTIDRNARRKVDATREAHAWAEVARKTNLMYTEYANRAHKVVVHDADVAPGWTDMKDVFLSEPWLIRLAEKLPRSRYLAAMKGLSYHELAHILYSPSGVFRDRLVAEGLHGTWNLLEDQRIESLLVAAWPRMGRLISVTVLELIVKGNRVGDAWPLVVGRRYLPRALRQRQRRGFANAYGADKADKVAAIVREYVTLVHPDDDDRAYELVKEMAALLGAIRTPDGFDSHRPAVGDEGGGVRPVERQREDARKAKADADKDAQDADAENGDGQGDGDGQDGDGDGQDGDGQGDGKGDGKSDGEGEGAKAGSGDPLNPGDMGGDSGDPDGPRGEGGIGTHGGGANQDGADSWDSISNVDDAVDQAISDTANELNETAKSLAKAKAKVPAWRGVRKLQHAGGRKPQPGSKVSAKRIAAVLRKVQDDVAAGRIRHTRSGRLNARRAGIELTDPKGRQDLWDRWQEDATQDVSAEVVILIDTSGSTSKLSAAYAEVLWILKAGLEAAGVHTTVASFNDEVNVVWDATQAKVANKGVPRLRVGGGTDPGRAIWEAGIQLRQSTAAIKLLLILTDGGWSMNYSMGGVTTTCDVEIARMNADGITTVLVGFENATHHFGDHACSVAKDLVEPRDVVPIVAEAIIKRQKRIVGARNKERE